MHHEHGARRLPKRRLARCAALSLRRYRWALQGVPSCALRDEIVAALEALQQAERSSAKRVLQVVAEVTGRHVEAHGAARRVLMEGRSLAAYILAIGDRVAREQAAGERQIEALLQAGVAAGEWPSTTDVPLRASLIRAALHGLIATWHVAPGAFDWRAIASSLADR
jgi:hypothetical protein